MLNVFPAVVAVNTSLNNAPRRTVATIVNPTREKMAPRASFLRKLMRTPQRIHTGNPMTGAKTISVRLIHIHVQADGNGGAEVTHSMHL